MKTAKQQRSTTERQVIQGILSQTAAADHRLRTYFGAKWGIFLRAPEVYFDIKRLAGVKLVPLAELAEIKFGLKSGCDKFFFPKEVTKEILEKLGAVEANARYGYDVKASRRIALIEAGDGSFHLIEKKFLQPEVHGLMDITSVGLDRQMLKRSVVLIPTPVARDANFARKYIHWGESEGFQEGETCKGRVGQDRAWYDLTGTKSGQIIWPKLQQYRHVVAYNPEGLICNCNLYDLSCREGVDPELLCAVLNSTLVALMKFLYGSQMGREANQVTEVFDVKMMLVPDVRSISEEIQQKLLAGFTPLRSRSAEQLVDVDSEENGWTGELAYVDRQNLDSAVLELLGLSTSQVSRTRDTIYKEITSLYRTMRIAEQKMQRFRSASSRGGNVTPQSIAAEIWSELAVHPQVALVQDFVSDAEGEYIEVDSPHVKYVKANLFHGEGVQIGGKLLALGTKAHCDFVIAAAESGMRGRLLVPDSAKTCKNAVLGCEQRNASLDQQFRELSAAFTADVKVQERVVRELWRKVR